MSTLEAVYVAVAGGVIAAVVTYVVGTLWESR